MGKSVSAPFAYRISGASLYPHAHRWRAADDDCSAFSDGQHCGGARNGRSSSAHWQCGPRHCLAQHRFRVLVDTGAARSLVTPAVVSSLGLRRLGAERIIGVTGHVALVQLVEVSGVGIGQSELPPFQAGVLELGPLRLGIQAVLGVNAFVGVVSRLISWEDACTYCHERGDPAHPDATRLRG